MGFSALESPAESRWRRRVHANFRAGFQAVSGAISGEFQAPFQALFWVQLQAYFRLLSGVYLVCFLGVNEPNNHLIILECVKFVRTIEEHMKIDEHRLLLIACMKRKLNTYLVNSQLFMESLLFLTPM